MKKLAGLSIRMICPLHGPIWRSDLSPICWRNTTNGAGTEPEEPPSPLILRSLYGDT